MASYPQNELYHFGIKGMKWGVRRTPEQLGHQPTAKKKPMGNARLTEKPHTKVDDNTLTEEEHAAEVARRRKLSNKKSNAELQKLNDGWFSGKDSAAHRDAVRLSREIKQHIGDFDAAYAEHSKDFDFNEQIKSKIDSAFLEKLGYANTAFGRKCIRPIWDSSRHDYKPVSQQSHPNRSTKEDMLNAIEDFSVHAIKNLRIR